MASRSASLADSGFPPAESTTVGLVKDKAGGGGGMKFGGGGVKFGGGGGVKFGGGGGVNVVGGCGAGALVCLCSALFSSDFLKRCSSAETDELV